MNEPAAKEWLNKAWHHFSSGQILYEANHYTDVIAIDLHYAAEVSLKAFLAYENKKILKTHNLIELHAHIIENIEFDEDDKEILRLISTYHIKGSYPTRDRRMPPREEIKEVLDFTNKLFHKICTLLNINPEEVKK